MTINIANTELNTKFNIGDTVYRINTVNSRELCPKCRGTGFTESETKCVACKGEGSIEKTILKPDDKPYVVKDILIIVGEAKSEAMYVIADTAYVLDEDSLCKTLSEAIEHCKRENSIEVMSLADIVVPKSFLDTYPSPEKMTKRIKELKKYGKFTNIIEVDRNNVLVDGYTTYVLAKGFGHTEVEVIRHDNK